MQQREEQRVEKEAKRKPISICLRYTPINRAPLVSGKIAQSDI